MFIFASLNGTISGWNGAQGTTAQIAATTPGAAYTGLAFGNNGTGNFLYAANSPGNRIDVFNGSFSPTTLAGSFADLSLPAGFTVYNVQHLGASSSSPTRMRRLGAVSSTSSISTGIL